jgi:hypothetical protein
MKSYPSMASLFFQNYFLVTQQNGILTGPLTLVLDCLTMADGICMHRTNSLFRKISSAYKWSKYQGICVETDMHLEQIITWFPKAEQIYLDLPNEHMYLSFRRKYLKQLREYKGISLRGKYYPLLSHLCINNPTLKHLSLSFTRASLATLGELTECINLEELILNNFILSFPSDRPMTNTSSFAFLSELKSLQVVNLSECVWVTGNVLEALSHCKGLEVLDLSKSLDLLTKQDFKHIAKMKSLQSLYLSGFSWYRLSEIIESICSLPCLFEVGLSEAYMDDPVKIVKCIVEKSNILYVSGCGWTFSSTIEMEKAYQILFQCPRMDLTNPYMNPGFTVRCFQHMAESRKQIHCIDFLRSENPLKQEEQQEQEYHFMKDAKQCTEVCQWISRLNGLETIYWNNHPVCRDALQHLFQCKTLRTIRIRADEVDEELLRELLVNGSPVLEKIEWVVDRECIASGDDPSISSIQPFLWNSFHDHPSIRSVSVTLLSNEEEKEQDEQHSSISEKPRKNILMTSAFLEAHFQLITVVGTMDSSTRTYQLRKGGSHCNH